MTDQLDRLPTIHAPVAIDHAPDVEADGTGPEPSDDLVIDLTFRTLRVSGDIDATNAGRLATSLTYAFELGEPVCVDMSRVSFMGSSGIRALLDAAAERQVVILHPSIEVRRVLEMLGLCARFGVKPYR